MERKKRVRTYTQKQFNNTIKALRGEQTGNLEYKFLFLIRRALVQEYPKITLSEEGRKILKRELFSIASFSSHWRIRVRQLVAIEILGMIGKNDPEIRAFLFGRLKNTYSVQESEALQNAIDYIDTRKKPVSHALVALTKTIKKDMPIERGVFTLLNINVLVETKNAATLSYPDAKEMYAWLSQQRFSDVHLDELIKAVLEQITYIYPMIVDIHTKKAEDL